MALEDNIGSLSLDNLLPKDGGDVSLDTLYKALDRLVASEAAKCNVNANDLVRVVHDGEVTWITAQQARLYLQSDSEQQDGQALRDNVERALKGEARILHQELRVLLAIATGTFQNLQSQGLIDEKESGRIKPSISRREEEIKETFSQLYEVEERIRSARRRQPLIGEYEQRMGQLLNFQSEGKMTEARELAQQLAMDKKKYVLVSRALEPDVKTSYYHRLDAQKTRKKTLNLQQTLCLKKEGAISLHIGQLESQMKTIEEQLDRAQDVQATDSAQAEIVHKAKEQLAKTDEQIQQASSQLEAVKSETQVLQKQEKETDQVIEHIAANVLQEQEFTVDVQSQVKNIEQRRKSQPAAPVSKPKTGSSVRMATSDRRK
ncbi:MAG: hypothetical protein ABIH23_15680 [bacterium]